MSTSSSRPELLAQLTEGVERLTTSSEWQRYLDFQSRFHRYSFGNVLLIAAQCHEATQVAGFPPLDGTVSRRLQWTRQVLVRLSCHIPSTLFQPAEAQLRSPNVESQ